MLNPLKPFKRCQKFVAAREEQETTRELWRWHSCW